MGLLKGLKKYTKKCMSYIIIYLLAVHHQQKNYNNVRETNKKKTKKNHVYRLVVFWRLTCCCTVGVFKNQVYCLKYNCWYTAGFSEITDEMQVKGTVYQHSRFLDPRSFLGYRFANGFVLPCCIRNQIICIKTRVRLTHYTVSA